MVGFSFDGSVVDGQDILWLTGVGVYHRPHAASVAIDLSVLSHYTEVTVGKLLHGALYPCLHIKLCVLQWHLIHLDGKAREHPCLMYGI